MACAKPVVPSKITEAKTSGQPELKENEKTRAQIAETSRKALNCLLQNNPNGLLKMCNPDDKMHRLVQARLLEALGPHQNKLSESEEYNLPAALATILKDHKEVYGLFDKPPVHRGPGSTSMRHPYELLSTASIIKSGGVKTSLGSVLTITEYDKHRFSRRL